MQRALRHLLSVCIKAKPFVSVCVSVLMRVFVCVSLFILRVFFADCDDNSDDHRLLCITESAKSVTLPFCRSFITVAPLLSFITGKLS